MLADILMWNKRTPWFLIDYSKSLSEVYQDAVKYFINRDRNFAILAALLTHRSTVSDEDLPYWVRDWRVPLEQISSFNEKDLLRAHGYIMCTVTRGHEHSACDINMIFTLPQLNDEEDEEYMEARREGRVPLREAPFDPRQHKTKTGITNTGTSC
ncbi:hypothetical protein GLAREA_05784 [Glarea lozoyensis ATCC 20868]|uniref:Uncharacterized protein n=1 Tax=Glarea lozoyensis (strain ATCC 20868 / MF5171) TaxID=1116229 RepID=S3DWX0_GLAL2|nr:uncharacterized protein GLAREA_05784 [Glarea lozoyensis ATCC 20868]EPE36446.1 hypothetical protein GLAREA_05784 [Glarea lozoyensis ATCC 20868]